MTRYTPLWEQAGSYAAGIDRRLLSALWPAAATTGLAVTATSGMVLAIAPGTAAVPSSNNTGSLLCVSDAIENVTLTAAPAAGNSRIDSYGDNQIFDMGNTGSLTSLTDQ